MPTGSQVTYFLTSGKVLTKKMGPLEEAVGRVKAQLRNGSVDIVVGDGRHIFPAAHIVEVHVFPVRTGDSE